MTEMPTMHPLNETPVPAFRGRGVALATGLALALGTAACADSGFDPDADPGDGATTLSVYLTDAPGDVADVWIEIDDIILQGGPEGPLSLLEEPVGPVSLLDLQDEVMLLVEELELEAGTYAQLRFRLGGAVLETVGGSVYAFGGMEHPDGLPVTGTLMCPSCAQSGLKVTFPGGIVIGEGANGILLDFDVAQSFGRQAGQSGRWVMRPLIKGIAVSPGDMDGNGDLPGGRIEGTVALAVDPESGEPLLALPVCGVGEDAVTRTLADFVPRATTTTVLDEGEPIAFVGSTTAAGAFQVNVLHEDSYALDHWNEIVLNGWILTWQAQVAPATVNVEEGEVVGGVTYTITAASCVPDDG
jgi:hypothetical protein